MTECSVPVDLLNPGQVFACLGMVEAAEILLGGAAGVFQWGNDHPRFLVSADGTENPVACVLRFLEKAEVAVHVPSGSDNMKAWVEKKRKSKTWTWGADPEPIAHGQPFPFPDPNSPATLPAVLRDADGKEVVIDYWGEGKATRRDNIKFWAGSGGRPGSALLRDALDLVRGKLEQHVGDPFSLSAAQTSSFRFDWRRDYIPTNIGFSPNKHNKGAFAMVGFPVVEILAAIGVSNARPKALSKLKYRYGVLGGDTPIDPTFLRAALGAVNSPLPSAPFRRFTMYLDWPGKEGDARCITHVAEENSSD